jgi:L-aspartate semialdehyde sulfurtransferase ferredoxin
MAVERYNLTFSKQMSSQPVLYNLGRKYKLIPVLERANLSEESGWVQVAFNGDTDEIARAIADLNTMGVYVTPIELAMLG